MHITKSTTAPTTQKMAPRSRRLSLDFIINRSAPSDHSSSSAALFDHHRLPSAAAASEIVSLKCECCGHAEDCTRGYDRRVRDRYCGRWLCGMCTVAVEEELGRLGHTRHIVTEEAVRAHLEVCRRFNKTVRVNPAMSVAGGMKEILRKGSKAKRGGGGCRMLRTCSALPSLGE